MLFLEEEEEGGTERVVVVVSCLTVTKVGVAERGDLKLDERVTRRVACRAMSSVAFRLEAVLVICTPETSTFGNSKAYFWSAPLKVDGANAGPSGASEVTFSTKST